MPVVSDRGSDVFIGWKMRTLFARVFQHTRDAWWKIVEPAGDVNTAVAFRNSSLHETFDQTRDALNLFGRSLQEIIERCNENRSVLDVGLMTPLQYLFGASGAVFMSDGDTRITHFAGPATIAVHNERDVARPLGHLRSEA